MGTSQDSIPGLVRDYPDQPGQANGMSWSDIQEGLMTSNSEGWLELKLLEHLENGNFVEKCQN